MKYSLGISNFLEEISSLSHSIVLLYFFALTTEEGFLFSPCYSLEICIQMGISFFFSFAFSSLLFSAICKTSSDNHFAFLHFFFLGTDLISASCTVSQTSVHSSSDTLSIRSTTPVLGIYLRKKKKTEILIQKYICTPMFIAALFTITKIWKTLNTSSTAKWIKKKTSAMKRNKMCNLQQHE